MPADNNAFITLMGAGVLQSDRNGFPNPWLDLASQYAPQNMHTALTLCEFLYVNNPTYRAASQRIINYFLTAPNVSGGDDDQRKEFTDILVKDFKLIRVLKEVGEDFMAYGNAFCSISMPFTRTLRCVKCKSVSNIKQVNFQFNLEELSFKADCPKCRENTRHMFKDYPSKDTKRIKLVRLDPKRVTIQHNFITQDANYYYELPTDLVSEIRKADHFIISTTPWEFIVAAKNKQRFRFHPDYFYHMKEPTLAGLELRGWGTPTILSAFKSFFRLQVLYRHDEALMMDYITPLRMLSPKARPGGDGNEIVDMAMSNWVQNLGAAIQRHRIDGADWNFVPFPVEYQAVGGEGTELSPKDLIAMEEERLLNARGVPAELYKGSLTVQAAPVALRLFEKTWSGLVEGFNDLSQWCTNTISGYLRHGEYETELESVTVIDDMDAKMMRFQLLQSGIISKETALRPMGLDNKDEFKKSLEEQKFEQQQSSQAQQDLEMANMSIDTPQGDSEGKGGVGTENAGGSSPGDTLAQADQIARQLLTLQEGDRFKRLAALRETNPTLHAAVKQKMEELRRQASSAGTQMAMPQVLAGGGGASSPGGPAQPSGGSPGG